MSKKSRELEDLLAAYDANVRALALETRSVILATVPGIEETVDMQDKVVGYGFGPGYANLICTIILSKSGVKLGIVDSATLPDPDGLLEGTGKRHRYVACKKSSDITRPGVKRLLELGVAAWKKKADRRKQTESKRPV